MFFFACRSALLCVGCKQHSNFELHEADPVSDEPSETCQEANHTVAAFFR